MSNGVVASRHGVRSGARRVPSKFGGGCVLGVGDGRSAALARVAEAPGAAIFVSMVEKKIFPYVRRTY